MFSVPRGVRGPTPAGPIDRWHSHLVCMKGHKRGLAPVDGSCREGSRLTQGSEMLHLWFTRDLRSAFAVHAPVAELCRDGLLTPQACRAGSTATRCSWAAAALGEAVQRDAYARRWWTSASFGSGPARS